ncbi:hypothetical protein, partial [Kurthia gibsonii]|uniref:hypothetical protein n=1 Tax=Kurthia gibsonii TaxID=33946 RepID=UPI001477158B
ATPITSNANESYYYVPIIDLNIIEGIKNNLAIMHKNHKIEVTMQKKGLAESVKQDITLGFGTWKDIFFE